MFVWFGLSDENECFSVVCFFLNLVLKFIPGFCSVSTCGSLHLKKSQHIQTVSFLLMSMSRRDLAEGCADEFFTNDFSSSVQLE